MSADRLPIATRTATWLYTSAMWNRVVRRPWSTSGIGLARWRGSNSAHTVPFTSHPFRACPPSLSHLSAVRPLPPSSQRRTPLSLCERAAERHPPAEAVGRGGASGDGGGGADRAHRAR